MSLMEVVFVYLIPSFATVEAIILLLIWLFMTPTGKLLLLKRLGLARRGKGYAMTAWDDRQMTTEEMDVYPEGAMEKKKKKVGSLTFYLAKPQDDTANTDDNLKNEQRDRDILPPYFLDGVLPIYFGHVSKAVATNPKALTALRLANRIDANGELKADAVLPEPVEYINDLGEKAKTNVMPINVLLPFDPVDIKKNFSAYWQQSNIDATKKRHQLIGAEKEKADRRDYFKLILVACVMGSIVIGAVTIASKIFGG